MARRVPVSAATREYDKIMGSRMRIAVEASRGASTVADQMAAKCAALTVPPGAASDYTELMRLIIEDDLLLNPEDVVWLNRWARCRQVYRIDPEVASELMDQPVEGDLPCEALRRLPYPIVYVEAPVRTYNGMRWCTANGFLAWLDVPLEDPHGPEQLMVCYIYRDRKRVLMPVPLTGGTLADVAAKVADDSSRATERILEQSGGEVEVRYSAGEDTLSAIAQVVNLLLYIISAEDDAEVVYRPPSERRGQRVGRRTNPETHRLVGAVMGRAIGAARTVAGVGVSHGGNGRTVSPHIRRAHWQHYWTGKRKGRDDGRFGDELVVRWIPPVFVNGDGEPIEVVHEG